MNGDGHLHPDVGTDGGVAGDLVEVVQTRDPLPEPQPLRRTRLVFLYSSDDDDDDDDDNDNDNDNGGGGERREGVVVNRNPLDRNIAVVVEAAGLNPAHEELCAMQREAEEVSGARGTVDHMPLFVEDTTGETARAAEGTAPMGRCRVKVVDVLPLQAGGGGGGGTELPLRRHMSIEEAGKLLQPRKRFREEEGGTEGMDTEGMYIEDADNPQLVLDGRGLVRAVAVDGYTLTVDESELQSLDSGDQRERREREEEQEDEDERPAANIAVVAAAAAADADDALEDEEGVGDYNDDDDDDDDDDELDAALFLVVVEQLVCCCGSDEIDDALREDGLRFLSRVQPFLQRLRAGEMSLLEFADEMQDDVARLQRALRRANRPKDAPIVIDGVLMDM